MGKKKKKAPKVWCYYCEREFEDEKILIQHQKAKHFKCHVCHKKLSTAGGMVIHVLQVHKESITKVPNSKPDRESTDIEIFGMEGIPPEVLAAHEGDQEDEKATKVAKIEVPPSGPGGLIMGPAARGIAPQPMYSAMPHAYVAPPPGVLRPLVWTPQQLSSQPWSTSPVFQPPVMAPRPPPPLPLQPLFPIQGIQNAPGITPLPSQPSSQPLFPIRAVMPPSSLPMPSAQPLTSINGSSPVPPLPVPGVTSFPAVSPAAVIARPSLNTLTTEPLPVSGLTPARPSLNTLTTEPLPVSGLTPTHVTSSPVSTMVGKTSNIGGSHMYASGPNTGCPIGPPPVISNKTPSQAVANEVYLVWDDEAMSMEERRMSLSRYQVHDEASQMHSVDAAIDRRILESRLAGRMTLGV